MIPTIRSVAAALAAALALSGCGGGSGSAEGSGATGGGTTTPPTGAAYTMNASTQPLTASTTVDSARAASAHVGLDGITLVATGADGTVYRLSIPADALQEPVTVTMTPLATLTGLPFGESAHGVRLEPDGQTFAAPVRLDIVPPQGQAWPLAQQIAIGLRGPAQHVTLAPVDNHAATPGLMLMHFSSYALVLSRQGLAASLAGLRQRLGGDAEQRVETALAEELQRERQIALEGRPDGGLTANVQALMHQFHVEVLAPRLAAAGTSCAAGRLAIQTLFMLQRQRQLMGLTPDDPTLPEPNTKALVQGMATVCMKEEYELCRDNHLIARMLPAAFGMLRTLELAGMEEAVPGQIEAYAAKCLRFELQLNGSSASTISNEGPAYDGFRAVETVQSRLPIEMSSLEQFFGEAPFLKGQAPLVSTALDVSLSDSCDRLLGSQRIGGTTTAFLDWRARDGDQLARAQIQDFRLGVTSVASNGLGSFFRETVRSHNNDGNCDSESEDATIYPGWITLGTSALFNMPGGVVLGMHDNSGIRGWTLGSLGDARLATREIDFTYSDDVSPASSTRVRMSLVLMHTPAER